MNSWVSTSKGSLVSAALRGEQGHMAEEQDLGIQLCFWTPGSPSCGQGLTSVPGVPHSPAGICGETSDAYVSPGVAGCWQRSALRGILLSSPCPALLCFERLTTCIKQGSLLLGGGMFWIFNCPAEKSGLTIVDPWTIFGCSFVRSQDFVSCTRIIYKNVNRNECINVG